MSWQTGRLSVVAAPSGSVLDLDTEVKPHLRVDGTSEDTAIQSMIDAAVGEIDSPRGWLGRSLLPRTLRLTFDCFPPDAILLPAPPVTAVGSVKYRDDDDVWQTVDTADYYTDLAAEPALLWAGSSGWPTGIKGGPDTFRVEYTAGYADAASIPKTIKQWLLVEIGGMYRDREPTATVGSQTRVPHTYGMLDNLRVRL